MVALATGEPCCDVVMGLYKPSGELIWLKISSQPLFASDTKPPIAVLTTFSECQPESTHPRSQGDSTVSIQQQMAELAAIYDHAPVGLCLLDADRRFVRVNDLLAEINGIPAADHIGRTVQELLPDLAANQEQIFQQVLETGQPILNIEVQGTTPSQPDVERDWLVSYYPFQNLDRQVCGISIIVQEITELKRLSQTSQANELIYRHLADTMPQILWTANPDGGVDYYNQRWYDYTGMTYEQTQGWGWKPVLHPDDLQRCIDIWSEAVQTGGFYQIEYRFRRASDGQYRWHLGRAFPLRDEAGTIIKWFGSSTDIHDQKQAIEERDQALERERAARTELEKASRIKDEFLAVVSHELRSPLNPILGWSRLLRSKPFDDVSRDRALETIERNAKLQSQLIDDLLDVSRILRGKLSVAIAPVNLVSVIEAAIETIIIAAETKSIQIHKHFEPQVGRVGGDFNRLQQVIWNLLTNAIKFTPEGGQVEIYLTQTEQSAQIQIRDTGKGIRADALPYIFERFRQADNGTTRQFGGLGLGLAIVQNIVEIHKGTIKADSAGENQGATFTVEIPLFAQPITEVAYAPPVEDIQDSERPLSGLKLLVVDDEADARELNQFLLEQYGATVKVAASATEALPLVTHLLPDLIVSDLGMPLVDGYEFIQRVRQLPANQGGEIPAIALTAYVREEDRIAAIAAGFQAHLTKPLEPTELLKTILRLSRG
ncbi:two-component hybrid sensor and regulator [Leptolyngbya sp. NIES-3755]|nr:two-component hybrid sensor and regulator [Leptolyngbya sp. NIES-3755]